MDANRRHLEDVLKVLDELEKLLRDYSYPGQNPGVLQRVDTLCIRMRGVDDYISEKAGSIQSLAAMFFSAKRHAGYPGGFDQLHHQIAYSLPHVIRSQVMHRLDGYERGD